MHFFGFNKCPTVDLVFKMPPECNICTMQCRQSGEEYWKFGTVHQRLSDQKPEVHKNMPGVLCYCCLGDKLAWDTFLGVYSEADEPSEGADEADECLQPITYVLATSGYVDGPPANLRILRNRYARIDDLLFVPERKFNRNRTAASSSASASSASSSSAGFQPSDKQASNQLTSLA